MSNLYKTFILLPLTLLVGCGSIDKTTTTKYDADGKVAEVVVTEREVSDFGALVAASDGNATTLSADISKFSLGWNGYGLTWFSVSGVRVKAPVNEDSHSADALEQTAEIIGATKTKLQTADFAVNTAVAKPQPESE